MILPLRLPLRLTLAAQALADPQHHNCFHQYVSDGGGLAFLPASFFYRSPFSATATSMSLRLGHERLHSASIGGGISPRQPQRHRQHQHRSGTTSSSFGTLPPENFMPSCRACRSLTSSTVVLKTAVGQDSGEEAQQASLNLQQQAGRRGHALRSPAAKEYYQRKRDMLRAEEDLIRDKCERCRRARKVMVVIIIKLSHVAVCGGRCVGTSKPALPTPRHPTAGPVCHTRMVLEGTRYTTPVLLLYCMIVMR